MPSFSRSIDDEGLRLRNHRFVRRGRMQTAALEAAWAGMAIPPRNQPELLADLQAQVAANQAGVLGLQTLVERYGQTVVQQQMAALQLDAAASVRRLLHRLDGGRQQIRLDDGSQVQLTVAVDRSEERLTLDFSGTSPQHPGNLNAPLAVTRAAVLYTLRCLLNDDIPLNDGCFAPVRLVVPEGCLLNPVRPLLWWPAMSNCRRRSATCCLRPSACWPPVRNDEQSQLRQRGVPVLRNHRRRRRCGPGL